MQHPPHPALLTLLILAATISGCTFYNTPRYHGPPPFMRVSPLLPTPSSSAPDDALYAPRFEDAATVPAWARPIAPQNSFNTLFSPDGQYLLYLTRHPGTRWTSLYSVPFAGGEAVLLDTGSAEEAIFDYVVSANSTRVIYYQRHSSEGLFSSTLAGTKRISLTNDKILEAAISPDGQWVVYWGGQEGLGPKGKMANDYALYAVPALGGDSVRLGGGLTSSGSYKISPDSRYVLYTAMESLGAGVPMHLYRVPIEGGAPVQLDQGEQLHGGGTFLISPDSHWIIFGNLYRVSIDGGTPEQLNPRSDAGNPETQFTYPPQISPDGEWLVFEAGERWENNVSLFSTPLAGGPVVQLNDPLGPTEDVRSFHISPNGQHVYYTQAPREDERNGVPYRVPISGGEPTAFPQWDGVYESLDGQWILATIWLEEGGSDIYSIPSAGGSAVKLNTLVPEGSTVAWSTVAPNSRTLIYATSPDAGSGMPIIDGIYAVPVAGGAPHELMGRVGNNRAFGVGFSFTPDGEQIIANADYDGDGRSALYVVEISTLLAPPK